ITAVTAQNTVGVQAMQVLAPSLVRSQIEAVATDLGVGALKIGMLGDTTIVDVVVAAITELGLPAPVVDPVWASSSGSPLLDEPSALLRLLPLARVVTPNLSEAAALTGLGVHDRASMDAAAHALVELGCSAALVTGGHLPGGEVVDCLLERAGAAVWIGGPRIDTRDTHGTGCVLSAAVAARLAHGVPVEQACRDGVGFVRAALANARRLGRGVGPVDPTPC
ncbi:MAG: bifunctional hydroxymethylpyrimidine kinase/phosphomethylpyrimidine kinase, partial [Acidimicrobiales bacterium]